MPYLPTIKASVPVVAIDTETNGLTRPYLPDGRRIWEVGLIRVEPDGTYADFHAFVDLADLPWDPDSPGDSRKGLEIGRFWDRHPQVNSGAKGRVLREADVAAMLATWFEPDPGTGARPYLLGCVPSFEDLGVADLLLRYGHIDSEPPWHYHLVDAETAAAARLRMSPPWDSKEITRRIGLDLAAYRAHEALEDARWALDLWMMANAPLWRIWAARARLGLRRGRR